MLSEVEQQRLREGMKLGGNYSLYRWRAYFSFLLGRYITIGEANEFLINEAKQPQEVAWSAYQQTR